MARKVITKKGWLYSNVRYFRDLSCFCLSCPLFLRLTRRWLVVCLPPLLRQLLIPPPTGGHISKPSRLAYNIQAAFLKKRRIICSRHLYLLSRHVQQQRTRLWWLFQRKCIIHQKPWISKNIFGKDDSVLVKVSKYYYHFFSSLFQKTLGSFNATICLKSHHSGSSNSWCLSESKLQGRFQPSVMTLQQLKTAFQPQFSHPI